MKTNSFPKAERPLYFLHSYGVSPDHGSEKGLGFNWLRELGRYYNVVVFCEAEFAGRCYERLKASDATIYIKPVSIGEVGRRMVWKQGTWIAYLFLIVYHLRVLLAAIQTSISLRERPSISHQLSMIGFRSPGYLALFRLLGAKVIWGPIGGLNTPPPGLYADYGPQVVAAQAAKNILNEVSLLLPSVLMWRLLANKTIIVTRPKSRLLSFFFGNSQMFPETFCKPEFTTEFETEERQTLDRLQLVTTGKPSYRKLHRTLLIELDRIAAELCSENNLKGVDLTILGCNESDLAKLLDGTSSHYLEVTCKHGTLDLVKENLRKAELYVHLSVDEGTSHAVVEAASVGLPIICFDVGGHTAYLCEKDIVMCYPNSRLEIGIELRKALRTYMSARDQSKSRKRCGNVVFPEQAVQDFLKIIDE